MSAYTCITCSSHFTSQEERENYNIKRKIASLAPLSKDLFDERQRHLEATKVEEKKLIKVYCELCRKSFTQKSTFDQHEKSKRHLQGLKQLQEEFQNIPEPTNDSTVGEAVVVDVKEEEEEKKTKGYTERFTPEEYEFIPCLCLFCRLDSKTVDSNLEHMSKVHGFHIPDHYLGQKISVGCICLGCNHGFKSPVSVRDHMISKGHSRMAYSTDEDFEEFEQYFDYTEINENPLSSTQMTETGELLLPDGRILGNREFTRYYKQNLGNENEKRQAIVSKMLLEMGHDGKKSNEMIMYEEKKKELVQKREGVERLNTYMIRERLHAGMNMNLIHLAHFSHR